MASDTAFLLDLGVLTAAALAFSLLFVKLRLPVVSAQIFAGMLVGPYVFGWVVDPVIIGQISSVGIVLLLFIIGLELDPLELQKAVKEITLLTLVEVGVAFAFGYLGSYFLRLSPVVSVIFAMTAAISSTAIVGKIILERRMIQAGESKMLVGIMIMEDIVAVVFLIVLSTLAPGQTLTASQGLSKVIITGIGGVSLLAVGYVVARFLAPYAIDYLSSYEVEAEEIPFLFALALGLLFGVLADSLGYSPGIGAFIIGLSVRGKQSKFLFEKVSTLKDLFLILFFVSMGCLINPFPSLALGLPIVAVLLLVVAGKFVGGYLVGWLAFRKSDGVTSSPLSIGAWLIPRGEFSFVIAQFALTVGLIDVNLFSLIGVTVLVTAIFGPIIQRFVGPRLAPVIHVAAPATD